MQLKLMEQLLLKSVYKHKNSYATLLPKSLAEFVL